MTYFSVTKTGPTIDPCWVSNLQIAENDTEFLILQHSQIELLITWLEAIPLYSFYSLKRQLFILSNKTNLNRFVFFFPLQEDLKDSSSIFCRLINCFIHYHVNSIATVSLIRELDSPYYWGSGSIPMQSVLLCTSYTVAGNLIEESSVLLEAKLWH